MRLHRLELIKYGKFTDRAIDFPASRRDFHLIIGPNEAGKSTLRSSILDLLFGIPTRSPLAFIHPLNELRLGALIGHAGDALAFHRAKAARQTLRTPADAVLPDAALASYLGAADRHFFDQMFGLDHARLVAGGNSILNAENDIGQVLFQSAAGVASLGKIRDALLAEAEKLWAPRKAADRAYYIAADLLDKANAALKESTVRTKVWTEAHARLEAAADALGQVGDQLRELDIARTRLERIRRTAPFLRAVRDIEAQLAALAHAADLPEDAAVIAAQAERDLATATQLLELRSDDVHQAKQALAAVERDDKALGCAEEIVALDTLRTRLSNHERDIGRRQEEVVALFKEIRAACRQLGWDDESEETLRERLPSLLTRRELGRLSRARSGLAQALRTAEQAEQAKEAEVTRLSEELGNLPGVEITPALHAALADARALGDTEFALQKQRRALAKATSALDAALAGLGQWRKSPTELAAMAVPGQQTIARRVHERQTLAAERRSLGKRIDEQQAHVAQLELDITQFHELHQPVTQLDVAGARAERDASWHALKTGTNSLAQGAQQFETLLSQADALADRRLDNVEAATELQTLQHQLQHARLGVAELTGQLVRLDEQIRAGDAQWETIAAAMGLSGLALDDAADWMIQRDKVLATAASCRDAQEDFAQLERTVDAARQALAQALCDAGFDRGGSSSVAALRLEAEQWIQAADAATVKREATTAQLNAAQTMAVTLQQATAAAHADIAQWQQEWSAALSAATLDPQSAIGTVEGALELITQIGDKLDKVHQIRTERIDTMTVELRQFEDTARHLAARLGEQLSALPAVDIAQALAERLAHAQQDHTEAARRQAALESATAQRNAAQEMLQAANASLKPLMTRAGVDDPAALAEAIARSDTRRRLLRELDQAKAQALDGGDGLTREQLEQEIDAVDLSQLPAELVQTTSAHAEAVQRKATLTAEYDKASSALAAIGGSDAAARAEAMRQEALAQMADATERYVKVFTAGRLLRWSIDRYREEKQGPMLSRAGAIFSGLTQGAYQRLVVDFDAQPMTLEGQRADGKLVGIGGMSDGTRDQLYLALRLAALELHLEQATPLPFIADDLFINYDDGRAMAGFEALASLSEKTQVIYLSHHDHLTESVRKVFGEQVSITRL
ncbi:ATP-binding protein [Noviherbaspirillum autotrophicum]|uniref:YhaN AAA domain-containing protein n=1 Tax=Noviherbaspirillum autotrophicum TaxID=709839 RepID=A0A0C1XZ53_9BURK|nr:YhaN family protein [Noviherbaspirillum autotrophicum]KIF80053.1 hypothetical protein TSA66_03255 [Noviherbaspirillum autotrophicum]